MWSKFKALTLSDQTQSKQDHETYSTPHIVPVRHQKVSPALTEILTHPDPPVSKNAGKSTSTMPKHLSSEQMIEYLQERRDRKIREELEKESKRKDREMRRKERQEEKERKRLEREKKAVAARNIRGRGRERGGRGRRRGRGLSHIPDTRRDLSPEPSDQSSSASDPDILCPKCQQHTDGRWVCCEKCDRWYHFVCVGLIEDESIESIDWNCSSCDSD